MVVTDLFTKPERKVPTIPVAKLVLKKSKGIVGDVNGDEFTPRQLLVTSKETLEHFNLKPGELRENVVLEGFDVDNLSSGDSIKIGDVPIRIAFHCEPCGFVESVQKGLLKKIEFRRGVLGVALADGEISVGDEVTVLENKYSKVPYKLAERFLWMSQQVPNGKVVSYKTLIKTMGLQSSYIRVIPAFIKKYSKEGHSFHRVVDSYGNLISYVDDQASKLHAEGIEVMKNSVDLKRFEADFRGFYTK